MKHSSLRKQLCRLALAAVPALLLTACNSDELFSDSKAKEGDFVDVTINLDTEDLNGLSGSATTRAASTGSVTADKTSSEDIVCERVASAGTCATRATGIDDPNPTSSTTIKNLWVLQYDGIGDDAKLVTSAYISNYGTADGQTQTAKLIASTADNTIIFLANTFDPNLPFQVNSTITELKARRFTTQSLGTILSKNPSTVTTGTQTFPNDGDYYQRLNGATEISEVKEGSTITGTLVHNACRITVNVTNNTAGTTYPVTLQYADVEKVPGCMYFYTAYTGYTSGTAIGKPTTSDINLYGTYTYSNVITWSESEGTSATTKSAKLYLSPNESGVISSSTAKLKSLFAPSRATILRIHGTYKDGSDDIPVTYSFALGNDMTQNYQLVPNGDYVYNITLNGRGDKTTDGRVSYGSSGGVDYTETSTWPLSNCYICNPPATGSATFKIPVARVDQFWGGGNYEDVQNNCLSPKIGGDQNWTVSVIWSDMPVKASNFELTKSTGTGKDAYFEVSIPSTCVKGNVIVGIKRTGEGAPTNWLWSWHLWVTDYCPDDAKYLTQQGAFLDGTDTYHVTGGDVQRYSVAGTGQVQKVFMDRCIGAMDKDASGYPRGTMYYQFGRKDPFPGNSEEYYEGGTNKTTHEIGYYSNTEHYTMLYKSNDGKTQNVPYSIYNPTIFIRGDGVNYWTYGDKYNLTSGNSDIYWQDPSVSQNGNKSIFDPSPSGWKVPTTYAGITYNTFSGGICIANTSAVKNGGSVSLPGLGYRSYSNGSLSGGGTTGYYWSSSPSGSTYAYRLYFYSGNLYAHSNNNNYNFQRAAGNPVRPVQE